MEIVRDWEGSSWDTIPTFAWRGLKKSTKYFSQGGWWIFYCIMVLRPLLDLDRFFSFLIHTQSVGLLERGISPSQGRYLPTEQHKHRINAQTSMLRVGFEPTIPVFERAKTVHALHRAAAGIGSRWIHKTIILPVVLYGCETWSLTVREEHKLDGVWEQGAEENIWIEERWNDRRLEKTT
jgi:hypothetical protein